MLRTCVSAHISSWLLPLLLLLVFDARAEGRAVKALNTTAFASYAWTRTEEGRSDGTSSPTPDLPRKTDGAWQVGGTLTAPLDARWLGGRHWLGGRLSMEGGGGTLEFSQIAGFSDTRADAWRIGTEAQVFARDPEFGHVDIGYRFDWESFDDRAVERTTTHAVTFDAGFYTPDQGAGEVDWDFSFSWGRQRERAGSQEDAIDIYTAGTEVGLYATKFVRIAGAFEWQRWDRELEADNELLLGRGEVIWLLPFGKTPKLSLRVYGEGGSTRTRLGAPLNDVDQTIYGAGGAITFSYPGASTLLELIRAYQ